MAFGQKWGYGWLWMAMAMICRFFMVLYGSMGLEFLGSWFHGMSSFMPWSDGWIMLDPSLCPRWTRLAFPRTSYSHSEGGSGSDPEHLLGILTNMHMSISHYQSTYHQILMIKICSWYQSISIDWVICHSSPYSSSNIIKYWKYHQISSNIENSDPVRISKEWMNLKYRDDGTAGYLPRCQVMGHRKGEETGDRRVPKPWAIKCGGNGLEWVGNSCFTCFRMVLTV